MRTMTYMSPIITVFMAMSMPASVGLYWVAGGFMMIIQTIIITFIVKPKIRKRIGEEMKVNPPKAPKSSSTIKDVTGTADQDTEQTKAIETKKENGPGRNAGKQRNR